MSPRCSVEAVLNEISGVHPDRINAVRAAAVVAENNAIKLIASKEIAKISRMKSAPPMGALKIAAIPAPAPHATNILMRSGVKRKSCAILLPIAAPELAIGPSDPADPPKPIVVEHVMIGARMSPGEYL